MVQRKTTTHTVIDKEVIITLRNDSTIWQCAYKVGNKWQRTSTGERNETLAKEKAKQLFYKAQSRTEVEEVQTPNQARIKSMQDQAKRAQKAVKAERARQKIKSGQQALNTSMTRNY